VHRFGVEQYEAKTSDVITYLLYVERATMKKPTVFDIELHGRLFAITGVISHIEASVLHLYECGAFLCIMELYTSPSFAIRNL
jgi:hypothetical protein